METKLKIRKVPIDALRPTQMTVGYRAVRHKRRQWRDVADSKKKRREFLEDHVVPVVIGPKEAMFATDHHHVARALLDEGVHEVLVGIHGDLRALPKWTFWNFMDQRSWCRPCDDHGRRHDFDDIPKTFADLLDDPYRSLAAAVERAGGYAKETMPFSEFLWADFFRTHVRRTTLEADFDRAVEKALVLARSDHADYLPGWCPAPGS